MFSSEYLKAISVRNLEAFVLQEENIKLLGQAKDQAVKHFKDLQVKAEEFSLGFSPVLTKKEFADQRRIIENVVDKKLGFEVGDSTVHYHSVDFTDPHGIIGDIANITSLGALSAYISAVEIVHNGTYFASAILPVLGVGILAAEYGRFRPKRIERMKLDTVIKKDYYDNLSGETYIQADSREDVVPSYSHERTHRIQHLWDERLTEPELRAFQEGHAMGVEEQMSALFAKEESNSAFLYGNVARSAVMLLAAYEWGQSGGEKTSDFKGVKKTPYEVSPVKWDTHRNYVIGYAFCSLMENKHGPELYHDLLREKVDVPILI